MEEKLFLESFGEALKKQVANIVTLGNLVLGMLALFQVMAGRYELGIILVLIAMVLDGADGKLALKLNAQSEMGKQLDSLCDLVSFGVVPALIIYEVSLFHLGHYGAAIAVLFPLAGAYRLARFNIASSTSSTFSGLPITMAGGVLAAFALHAYLYETWMTPFFVAALAYLMVSRIEYPAAKKGREIGLPRFLLLYSAMSGFVLLILFKRELVLYLLTFYVVSGLLGKIIRLKNAEKERFSFSSAGENGD